MDAMETVASAQSKLLGRLAPLGTEEVALAEAPGRVLATAIVCGLTLPAFANSSMDGYAVRAADTTAAPVTLRVDGESRAGSLPTATVVPGSAVLIMTGAPLPAGADAVVRREDTDDAPDRVRVMVTVKPGTYVRCRGEDMRTGDMAIPAGVRLRSHHLAVCAALGLTKVPVSRQPRVALLSTGDELVNPGVEPGPGQVVDSNAVALAAAIRSVGGLVVPLGIARDDPADIEAKFRGAVACDLVISSAGVSVGDHDHVRDVVSSLGGLDFWRVAMRPGKPLAIGHIGGVPFLGLPGNPVSSQVTFELFGRPAILAMQGACDVQRRRLRARTSKALDKPVGLETFHRGVLTTADDGVLEVALTGAQGSGIIRSLADADCLLVLPADAATVPAGTTIDVIPLD